jgi:hypothetical protein
VTSPVRDARPVTPSLAADPAAVTSAAEPEPEAIECAEPQPPPSISPVSRREAIAGELDDRRAQWLGRQRQRPRAHEVQPRRLALTTLKQVQRDLGTPMGALNDRIS